MSTALKDTFRQQYPKLTLKQVGNMAAIKNIATRLEQEIELALPEPSRERSLAMTKLEEAVMWASKGITAHGS